MFQGSIVALITPMLKSLQIDLLRYEELIEKHIEAGTNALVIAGTTGESLSLTPEEWQCLVKTAVSIAKGRIKIIAGTGASSTQKTLECTQIALKLGVEACLIVTPAYNRPTQQGLYEHYKYIANQVPIPILLYNVPSRTACDLLPETVVKLAKISNIIGLKEALNDSNRLKTLVSMCNEDFVLLSGDDASALSFMLQGAKGVISVTANVVPKLMQQMCTAALQGQFHIAAQINTRLMPLHKSLFIESNPIPVKWLLSEMGWIENYMRLPLTPLLLEHQAMLREALMTANQTTTSIQE